MVYNQAQICDRFERGKGQIASRGRCWSTLMEGSYFAQTRFELSNPIATFSSQFTASAFLVGGVGGAVTVFRLDGCFCRILPFEVKDLTFLRRCWVHSSDGWV